MGILVNQLENIALKHFISQGLMRTYIYHGMN